MSLPDDFQVRAGDALEELRDLPDGCVHCCVTSPPYWGLRDYGAEGQIGLEESVGEYVEALVDVFREVRRVLRPDGTLWLNLGDSYAGGGSGPPSEASTLEGNGHVGGGPKAAEVTPVNRPTLQALKPKDLIGVPWRVALALQEDGWWLRSDVIWQKPNPMPESVSDRPTSSHEHVFLLAASRRYFYDAQAVREEAEYGYCEGGFRASGRYKSQRKGQSNEDASGESVTVSPGSGGTRNKRDVWEITTKPYPDAHFAVYPPELVVPCVEAGTSERGCCAECGAPLERDVERPSPPDQIRNRGEDTKMSYHSRQVGAGQALQDWYDDNPAETVGWSRTCEHEEAGVEPCLVLDPFAGAGTTGVVCSRLGRRFLGIELNEEYAEMARERIRDAERSLFAP